MFVWVTYFLIVYQVNNMNHHVEIHIGFLISSLSLEALI